MLADNWGAIGFWHALSLADSATTVQLDGSDPASRQVTRWA